MRTMFADQVEAWEHAQQEGVSLLQHVAETMTAHGGKPALVTPPAAFPAVFAPVEVAPPTPPSPLVPAPRPARSVLWFALAAVLAVLIGAIGAFIFGQSDHDTPTRTEPEVTVKMKVAPPEAPGSGSGSAVGDPTVSLPTAR